MFSNPPQNNNFIFAELFIPTLTLETYEQTLLQYSTPNNNNYNKDENTIEKKTST